VLTADIRTTVAGTVVSPSLTFFYLANPASGAFLTTSAQASYTGNVIINNISSYIDIGIGITGSRRRRSLVLLVVPQIRHILLTSCCRDRGVRFDGVLAREGG